MRLPCLALLALALQVSPAAAQALRLTDSLVAGAWEIPDLPDDPQNGLAGSGFFTPQHTFEQTLWIKRTGYSDSSAEYVGIRITGTWFIRDTLLGVTLGSCEGFTEPGRRECAMESDELGDTDYVTVEVMDTRARKAARVMRDVAGWRLPLWHYAGPVRNPREPAFWKEAQTLSLSRDRRDRSPLPASLSPVPGNGAPAFDALGRNPSGKVPVRLFRPLPAVSSR